MKIRNPILSAIALTAATLAMVTTSPVQAAGRNPHPGVIPPGGTFRGLTYGEWGARFWTKLFAIPVVEGIEGSFDLLGLTFDNTFNITVE